MTHNVTIEYASGRLTTLAGEVSPPDLEHAYFIIALPDGSTLYIPESNICSLMVGPKP